MKEKTCAQIILFPELISTISLSLDLWLRAILLELHDRHSLLLSEFSLPLSTIYLSWVLRATFSEDPARWLDVATWWANKYRNVQVTCGLEGETVQIMIIPGKLFMCRKGWFYNENKMIDFLFLIQFSTSTATEYQLYLPFLYGHSSCGSHRASPGLPSLPHHFISVSNGADMLCSTTVHACQKTR